MKHRFVTRQAVPLAGAVFLVVLCLVASIRSQAEGPKSVWDGVYTEAQARSGETVFTATCAECHGDDMAGREQAPALVGPAFMEKWNQATLRRLYESIEEMPPDEPKSRQPREYVEAMAYVLYANEFPVGKVALPTDRTALADIQISSTRPEK